MLEESSNEVGMDVTQLTKCKMEDFDYVFDELAVAQMMFQDESNRELYDLETAQ